MSESLSIKALAALILSSAFTELFPDIITVDVKITDLGYHVDFIAKLPKNDQLFVLLEEKMKSISKQQLEIETLEMLPSNASDYLKAHQIPFYWQGIDKDHAGTIILHRLGKACHIFDQEIALSEETKPLHFKLLSYRNAKVYKGGKEISIFRVTGSVFTEKSELKNFLKKQEIYKKIDHLPFLSQHGWASLLMPEKEQCGLWIWNREASLIRERLFDICKSIYQKDGFYFMQPPIGIPFQLAPYLEKNGGEYQSEFESEGVDYIHQPSLVDFYPYLNFANGENRKIASIEKRFLEGTIDSSLGLFNSREQTCDRLHQFCSTSELAAALNSAWQQIQSFQNIFDIPVTVTLYTTKGLVNTPHAEWSRAVSILKSFVQREKIEYKIDSTHGMFFGPRIQWHWIDGLGRSWEGSFIELDLYSATQVKKKAKAAYSIPTDIIRHSLMGVLESFFAILLEKYGVDFPLWLAPKDILICVSTPEQLSFAQELERRLCLRTMHIAKITLQSLHLKKMEHKKGGAPIQLSIEGTHTPYKIGICYQGCESVQFHNIDEAVKHIESYFRLPL